MKLFQRRDIGHSSSIK